MAGSGSCPGCRAAISFTASRCPRCGRELQKKSRWAKSEISFGPVGRLGWTAPVVMMVLLTPYFFMVVVLRWAVGVLGDLWKPVARRL